VRNFGRRLLAAPALALAAALPAAAPGQDAAPGPVSVARTTGNALILWDASSEVAEFVTSKTPDDRANAQLRRDAVRVAAANIFKLEKSAKTLTVKVMYNKKGPWSPDYHADTFGGVVHYADLEFPYKAAEAGKDHWKSLDAKSQLPSWMKFTVLDKLPH